MQTIESSEQDFVSSFALQRQRLLLHAGSLLGQESSSHDSAVVTQLSQTLLTSLELLKVAEEELREERRTNAMRTSVQERRLAHLTALFDLAPTMLLLTAMDTTIRESNQKAADILGWSTTELAGRRLSDLVPATQRAGFKEQLAHAVVIGNVAAWSFNLEMRRTLPTAMSATVRLIEDAAVGTRALYWSLRPA